MASEPDTLGSEPFTISLQLPPGENQQAFLDHFNAALRGVGSSHTGSAGFRPNGIFQSSVTITLPIQATPVTLNWTVTKLGDGTLRDIAVATGTHDVDPTAWHDHARSLVTTALADALSDKRRRFFRRVQFHYVGPLLAGEYWLPGFRIAPVPVDTPEPLYAERVIDLDFYVHAVDDFHSRGLAQEIARRHAARLSLLLDVGLFVPLPVTRWVLDTSSSPIRMLRYQHGFIDTRPEPTAMPSKGELCPLGSYSGSLATLYPSAGNLLHCPQETRRVLRGLDTAVPRIQDAFDRCARLWQVANVIGDQFPSSGLAYRIAAADAVAQGNPEYTSFTDFIQRHTPPSPTLEPVLDYLFRSVRSAHFHGGAFPLGEFDRVRLFDRFQDQQALERSRVRNIGYNIIRNAITSWILESVPVEGDEPS